MSAIHQVLPQGSYRDIPTAIARGDSQFIIDAFHSLPLGANPTALMRMGFEVMALPGVVRTFAAYCASVGQVGVLEHFIKHNGLGITLTDCCTKKTYGGLSAGFRYESLALAAVDNRWTNALRLALDLEPDHPDVRGTVPSAYGSQSLLFKAVYKAVQFGHAVDVTNAQMLFEHGVPMVASNFRQTPAASCLFELAWQPKATQGLRRLLADFHRSGMIDLNAPVERHRGGSLPGHTPLGLAINLGLTEAAADLVHLGSTRSVAAIRPGSKDIIESIEAANLSQETKQHMVSRLSEALMQRRIEACSSPMGERATDARPAASPERRRACL